MRYRIAAIWVLRAFVLPVCVALVAAIGVSRWYWGYWFSRPDLDSRILEARRYVGLAFIQTSPEAGYPLTFVDNPATNVSRELKNYREEDDSIDNGRVLHELDQRGLLSPIPLRRTVELSTLLGLIQRTGALVEPSPGYSKYGHRLKGLILEAEGHDGRRLLFLALRGGQLSNDHYPVYEFLFEASPGTEHFQRVSLNRWFIDIAGMEGIEWYGMLLFFVPISLSVTWIGLAIYVAILWWRELRAARAGVE